MPEAPSHRLQAGGRHPGAQTVAPGVELAGSAQSTQRPHRFDSVTARPVLSLAEPTCLSSSHLWRTPEAYHLVKAMTGAVSGVDENG